jgi:hypothetical protein
MFAVTAKYLGPLLAFNKNKWQICGMTHFSRKYSSNVSYLKVLHPPTRSSLTHRSIHIISYGRKLLTYRGFNLVTSIWSQLKTTNEEPLYIPFPYCVSLFAQPVQYLAFSFLKKKRFMQCIKSNIGEALIHANFA